MSELVQILHYGVIVLEIVYETYKLLSIGIMNNKLNKLLIKTVMRYFQRFFKSQK